MARIIADQNWALPRRSLSMSSQFPVAPGIFRPRNPYGCTHLPRIGWSALPGSAPLA